MRLEGKEVLVATRNPGKVREFRALFQDRGIRVTSLNDISGAPEVVEDGETFAENARKKAWSVSAALDVPVIADDSGLCVDALDGRPGVRSARYAGENATDEANNRKLLEELRSRNPVPVVEKRGAGLPDLNLLSPARFVCAIALADAANGDVLVVEASLEGMIADAPHGSQGFGYDPLFYVPESGRTMAEMDLDEKNRISHRARAMKKLVEQLESS